MAIMEEINVATTETYSDKKTTSLKLLLSSNIFVNDWSISSTGNDNTPFIQKHIVAV